MHPMFVFALRVPLVLGALSIMALGLIALSVIPDVQMALALAGTRYPRY